MAVAILITGSLPDRPTLLSSEERSFFIHSSGDKLVSMAGMEFVLYFAKGRCRYVVPAA